MSLARRSAIARFSAQNSLETVGNSDHGSAGLMLVLCGDEKNRPHRQPWQLELMSHKCRLDAARLWYTVPDRSHGGACLGEGGGGLKKALGIGGDCANARWSMLDQFWNLGIGVPEAAASERSVELVGQVGGGEVR